MEMCSCLPFSDRRLNTHACIRPRTHVRARSRDTSRPRARAIVASLLLFRRCCVCPALLCYLRSGVNASSSRRVPIFFSPVHVRTSSANRRRDRCSVRDRKYQPRARARAREGKSVLTYSLTHIRDR